MKKAIIAILICVNVGLLMTLIVGVDAPTAHANYPGAVMPNNTIMITGQVRINEDAVYILDMASERLAGFEFQRKGNAKKLRALGARDLKMDLK
jgi:hypothetical protein